MIPIPPGIRVWIATGHTDMRRGRRSWLFAGSDHGGERAAVLLTLIHTAKLNDVDPQAWLADVLARINDHSNPQARRPLAVELGR